LFKYYLSIAKNKHPFKDLESLLDTIDPDVIIHPTVMEGLFVNDLVEQSRSRDVPFVMIMNSWDNPSTKRAMIGNPDWLLVWGDQTNRHAREFAGMPASRTLRFGAAQFDLYSRPAEMDRQEFLELHDLPDDCKVLLYAGSSKETAEIDHLKVLDDAIEQGRYGKLKVIYRPHPWGGGGRGGDKLLDHPWKNIRIESSMRRYLELVRRDSSVMSYPDYKHTHNVLSNVDMLISPLSTIIVEAAMHGKAVMCLLPEDDKDAKHFQGVVKLVHFEDMFNMKDVVVAKSLEEMLAGVFTLQEQSAEAGFAERIQKETHYFVEPYEETYSMRLKGFIEGLSRGEVG